MKNKHNHGVATISFYWIFLILLQITLVILKYSGLINWNWAFVLMPVWGGLILELILAIVMALVIAFNNK